MALAVLSFVESLSLSYKTFIGGSTVFESSSNVLYRLTLMCVLLRLKCEWQEAAHYAELLYTHSRWSKVNTKIQTHEIFPSYCHNYFFSQKNMKIQGLSNTQL